MQLRNLEQIYSENNLKSESLNIDRGERAAAIERLFAFAKTGELKVVFTATALLDRLFVWKHLPSRDKYEIFLTALVSLAIVAKEEKPFPITLMVELDKFLRKMFKPEQLARKEMELRTCLSDKCNIVVFLLESINLMS